MNEFKVREIAKQHIKGYHPHLSEDYYIDQIYREAMQVLDRVVARLSQSIFSRKDFKQLGGTDAEFEVLRWECKIVRVDKDKYQVVQ